MRIVVTGGCGFIGSHIVEAYLEEGHQVLIIDNLTTKRPYSPPNAGLLVCSVASETAIRQIKQFQPQVINHHAAHISVTGSIQDPIWDAYENVIGSLWMMAAATECNSVEKFIFASSGGEVYGHHIPNVSEDTPLKPVTPYGISKATAEIYLNFYRNMHHLPHVALRYSNVYGPRQNPQNEAGVVAIFTESLLKRKTCYINGDGMNTRDYVYVQDVARANVAALTKGSGPINIGTGIETSVNTLFDKLSYLAGNTTHSPVYQPMLYDEIKRKAVSCLKAKEELGWEPLISLDIGLSATIDYFRKYVI